MKLVLSLLLALLGLASINAQTSTSTWTAGSGTWNTAANWQGGVPTSTSIVIITGCNGGTGDCVVTIPAGTNASCFNLTVSFPGSNSGLVVAGTLSTTYGLATESWINVSGTYYGTLDAGEGSVALLPNSYTGTLAGSGDGTYVVMGPATVGNVNLNSYYSFAISGNWIIQGTVNLTADEESPIVGSSTTGANITLTASSYFYMSNGAGIETLTVYQYGNSALNSGNPGGDNYFNVYHGTVYNLMPGATLYAYDTQFYFDDYNGNVTFNNWGTIIVMAQYSSGDDSGFFRGLDSYASDYNFVVNGNFTFNNWGFINGNNYSFTDGGGYPSENTYSGGLTFSYVTFNQMSARSWLGLLYFYYSDLFFTSASGDVNNTVNYYNSSLYISGDYNDGTRSSISRTPIFNIHVMSGLTFNNFALSTQGILIYTNGTTFNNTNFSSTSFINSTMSGVLVVNFTGYTGAEDLYLDTYDWSGNPYSALAVHNTRGSVFAVESIDMYGQTYLVNNGTVTALYDSDTTISTSQHAAIVNLPGALFDYSPTSPGTGGSGYDTYLNADYYGPSSSLQTTDPAFLAVGGNWYNFGEFRIAYDFIFMAPDDGTTSGLHYWNVGNGVLSAYVGTGGDYLSGYSIGFDQLTLLGTFAIRYQSTSSSDALDPSSSSYSDVTAFTWNSAAYQNNLLSSKGMFAGTVTSVADYGSASQVLADGLLALCYNPSAGTYYGSAIIGPFGALQVSVCTGIDSSYSGTLAVSDFTLSSALPPYLAYYTDPSFALGGPAGSGTPGTPTPGTPTPGTPTPGTPTPGTPTPGTPTTGTPTPGTPTPGTPTPKGTTTTGTALTPSGTSSSSVVVTSVFLMMISAFLLFL